MIRDLKLFYKRSEMIYCKITRNYEKLKSFSQLIIINHEWIYAVVNIYRHIILPLQSVKADKAKQTCRMKKKKARQIN